VSKFRAITSFAVWTLLPIATAAAGSILGVSAQLAGPGGTDGLRIAALILAICLAVLLIAKSIRDRSWQLSLEAARYEAVRELHNRLAPALDLMTEMALLDSADQTSRRLILRNVASDCCGALVAMTPTSKDVRATVFELAQPDTIAPLARFGRSELSRTFALGTPAGDEVMAYLENGSTGQLVKDTLISPPPRYEGDPKRYRTYIRVPIRGNEIVFGMLTVDAPKPGTLKEGDVHLAELVAAELGAAFAIAAA
jgi:GAF domain-containing protein